jgi:hypothetical protein
MISLQGITCYLSKLGTAFITTYAAHAFIQKNYPEVYDKYFLYCSEKLVKTISEIEFMAKPYLRQMNYLKHRVSIFFRGADVHIIKYNDAFYTCAISKIKQQPYFDFFIYNDFDIYDRRIEKGIYEPLNKVILFSEQVEQLSNVLCERELLFYDLCNYKFMSSSLSFKQNGQTYNLKLQTPEENYYVVNNRLNSLVVCYLLKIQHGIDIFADNIKYDLTIIDNKINHVVLTEKQELIFRENDYVIQQLDTNEEDTDTDSVTDSGNEPDDDSDDSCGDSGKEDSDFSPKFDVTAFVETSESNIVFLNKNNNSKKSEVEDDINSEPSLEIVDKENLE